MSFVRKKQDKDIFGLTLNDSIWKQQPSLIKSTNDSNYHSFEPILKNPNYILENKKFKRDNSCFQYGFPSLFELNKIHSIIQKSSDSFNINNNINIKREINNNNNNKYNNNIIINQEIIKENSLINQQGLSNRFQKDDDKQFYSLFQYDLLFNKKIDEEKSVTQNCPCCPPLKSSFEIQQIKQIQQRRQQQQKDSIITKKKDDDYNDDNVDLISYLRPISINHETLYDNPSPKNNNLLQIERKKVQSVNNVNNSELTTGGRLIEMTSNRVNNCHLNNESNNHILNNINNNKPFENERFNKLDKIVHSSVSLKDERDLVNMTLTKGKKSVQTINKQPVINNEILKDFKSKSQSSSTLTVERVQSILEFYHHSTASKDFTFEKKNNYSDGDISLNNIIDAFNVSNVNNNNNNNVSNIKLFKCAQCDKEFSDKISRGKHVRNDHKFICKICSKVSFHVTQMQHHEERVHGIYIKKKPKRRGSRQTKRKKRTYFCCGQTFKSGREFGIHKSTHKFVRREPISVK